MSSKLLRTTITAFTALVLGAGVAACGNESESNGASSDSSQATPATTPASAGKIDAAIQKKAKTLRSNMEDGQQRLEKITKDIQAGKVKPKDGQRQIEKITKDLQDQTKDFSKEAAETAANEARKSGEKVTELHLDGSGGK